MTASELEAVNRWITNVEIISPSAVDAVRDNPTKANAQAAADAQDAAMKAEEQRQQAAIGAQRRAIEAGKGAATKKKIKKTEAARAFERAFKPIEAETPDGGTKQVPVENVIDQFFGITRTDWTDPNLIKAHEAKGEAHKLRNSQKLAERTEEINAFFRDYVIPSGAYQNGTFDIKAVKTMGLTHKQAQLVEYFDTWFPDFDDDTIAAIYEASGGKEKKKRINRSLFAGEQITDDAPRKPKGKGEDADGNNAEKSAEEKGEINEQVNDTRGGIVQIKTANEDDALAYARWLSANKPKQLKI